MQIFNYENNDARQILALGPESNGNFSFFRDKKIYFSKDFGDLLVEANFRKFKSELNKFLKKLQAKPDIILTDLHPLYKTTVLGKDLAKKYKAKYIQVQHHIAHIFSQLGENMGISNFQFPISKNSFYGIALDGTGYGLDGKIWGGECFAISNFQFPISNKFSNSNDKISSELKITRIGHLENQTMIGSDLAIQEPARMLISILNKFLSKEKIYQQIKKYYSAQEFEVLYNQLQQNFNCIETSSTGRVLDAVSLLLEFCTNERNYKHEPIDLLEKNSTNPYADLKPKIYKDTDGKYILDTTYLFKYLLKYPPKDRKRLAATAQLYIAQGLHEIIKLQTTRLDSRKRPLVDARRENQKPKTFIAGGIANNKIISAHFEDKKTGIPSGTPAMQVPRGDAGLSFGQVVYFTLR